MLTGTQPKLANISVTFQLNIIDSMIATTGARWSFAVRSGWDVRTRMRKHSSALAVIAKRAILSISCWRN